MIVVRRPTGTADKGRAYRVLLDDRHVGDVHDGEAKQVPAPAGVHTLQLRVNRGASRMLEFELSDAEMTFDCGSNAGPSLLSGLLKTKDRIWLKQVG